LEQYNPDINWQKEKLQWRYDYFLKLRERELRKSYYAKRARDLATNTIIRAIKKIPNEEKNQPIKIAETKKK
jgi:hypothetical protein